jgi:hypothetical protein
MISEGTLCCETFFVAACRTICIRLEGGKADGLFVGIHLLFVIGGWFM